MKKLKFEWYVLNGTGVFNRDDNSSRIKPYNIFSNIYVNNETNKLCTKYKKKKSDGTIMTFDEFVDELMYIIMYEEWARTEYEICVADWPPVYRGKEGKRIPVYYNQEHEPIDSVDMWKIDCYSQALPNIRIIAKYVLEEYYPKLKINLDTKEADY